MNKPAPSTSAQPASPDAPFTLIANKFNEAIMQTLTTNEQGGITYATPQRIGQPEHRSEVLADVRMVCDGLQELCENIRKSWPDRYPMPDHLDAMIKFQDYALARVRCGSLRRFAEACAQ